MSRWTYIIPRLIILLLLATAVWASADPLARKIIVNKLETSTGAKVNVAQVKCSLANHKVYLKGLTIADPKNPMQNLIQADMAYLNLNPMNLLNRQIVIEYGQASKVMFGVPRTQKGLLDGSTLEAKPVENASLWEPKPLSSMDLLAQNWVDQLSPVNEQALSNQTSSLKLTAEKSVPSWKKQIARLSEAILKLQQSKAEYQAISRSNFGNPLRRNQVDTTKMDQANATAELIETQLLKLGKEVSLNRSQFEQAYLRDKLELSRTPSGIAFDADSVTKLLLTNMQEENVATVLGWLHFFRASVPDPESDFNIKAERGVNVALKGLQPQPGFLIKAIDLEGEGWFANQHFDFAGTANNISTAPKLHDQPASFDLRAQGNQHFIVSCVLDRRGETPIDTLGILCPALEIPGRLLGNKNSMQVTLGPESRVQADINIQVNDNQLSGDIVFRHSNVSLHVDELHEFAGGKTVALQMNRAVGEIKRFDSKLELSGTIDDYQFDLKSDLGQQFAQSVNGLLNQKRNLANVEQLRSLDLLYKEQISQIDTDVLPLIQRLLRTVNDEQIEIAALQESTTSDNGFSRIR